MVRAVVLLHNYALRLWDFLAFVVALRAGVGSSPDSEIPFCLRAKRNQKRALNTHGGTHAAPSALCSNSRRESVLGRCVRHFALLVPFASVGVHLCLFARFLVGFKKSLGYAAVVLSG